MANIIQHFGNQLGEVTNAATADKQNIQQMSKGTNDLLQVVEEMQASMKHKDTQIAELMKQNAALIAKMGTQATPTEQKTQQELPALPEMTAAEKATALALKNKIEKDKEQLKKSGKCQICGRHNNTARCFKLKRTRTIALCTGVQFLPDGGRGQILPTG